LSGDQFLAWTIGVLRYKDALPILPHLIASFHASVYDLFVLIDGLLKMPHWNDRDFRSEGFELSARCSEGAQLPVSEREDANESVAPEAIARVINPVVQRLRDQCELWNVPAAPAMISQAVKSDVPVLLLSGAYDPATPPHWAQFAAEHLSISWTVVFPHVGHGVLESDECAGELVRAWLSDPFKAPEAECVSSLKPPQFVEQDQDGG
jgi:pimeloyl-ACP methyl ester carboxylesterase